MQAQSLLASQALVAEKVNELLKKANLTPRWIATELFAQCLRMLVPVDLHVARAASAKHWEDVIAGLPPEMRPD